MEGEHRDEPHNGHKAPAFAFDPRLDLVRAPPQPVLDPVRCQGAGQEKRHGAPTATPCPRLLRRPQCGAARLSLVLDRRHRMG